MTACLTDSASYRKERSRRVLIPYDEDQVKYPIIAVIRHLLKNEAPFQVFSHNRGALQILKCCAFSTEFI